MYGHILKSEFVDLDSHFSWQVVESHSWPVYSGLSGRCRRETPMRGGHVGNLEV